MRIQDLAALLTRLQLFHLFGYGLVLIGVFVAARKPKDCLRRRPLAC
jgi:hypothetical protein